MLTTESVYINDYYGVFREIFIEGSEVKIVFNAFLNEDLDFTFIKGYSSEKEATDVVYEFINSTECLKEDLAYSAESIYKINKSIHNLISNILVGKVNLPSNGEGYQYVGDMEYLKKLKERNVSFVYFE